jgi:hypothetical protein
LFAVSFRCKGREVNGKSGENVALRQPDGLKHPAHLLHFRPLEEVVVDLRPLLQFRIEEFDCIEDRAKGKVTSSPTLLR